LFVHGSPWFAGFGAGGGIVADSAPRAQWEELLLKSKAFTLALRGARDAPREVAT
jgi:anthranilate/para-aminobenzoate synthase component I